MEKKKLYVVGMALLCMGLLAAAGDPAIHKASSPNEPVTSAINTTVQNNSTPPQPVLIEDFPKDAPPAEAVLVAGFPMGGGSASPREATAGSVYSNLDNFSGYVAFPGGITSTSGTRITKLLADDLQCTLGGIPMAEFSFTMANNNTSATNVYPLIRFYENSGSNTPGTLLGGWNFSAISVPASYVGIWTASVSPTWNIPANGKMWVGLAFATTTGSTTVRNNIGVALCSPAVVGTEFLSNADWLSTSNGGTTISSAFTANNPAGTVTTGNYSGGAARNHGYEIVVNLGACCGTGTLSCQVMTQAECTTAGGTYLGNNTACSGLDCNGNGIDDTCDKAGCTGQAWCSDCNENGTIDVCDISTGFSEDCQPDGIPDECELGTGGSGLMVDQGFNDITNLPGWYTQNNSSPLGSSSWFQGNTSNFTAQAGPDNSYISANYNNTGSTGTISNWLLTPAKWLQNGVVLDFYTRGPTCTTCYADRMQVRMSLNGDSTNVGSTATSVGDFTTLLLDINPTYVSNGYPQTWAAGHYTITLSGIATPTKGRIAFRYFVENGGASGANSNLIGIDTVTLTDIPGPPSNDQNENGVPDECDVTLCGDFEPDGDVDEADYWYIHDGMGYCSPNYKYGLYYKADLDSDNCITQVDWQMWLECYRAANGKDFVPPVNRKKPVGGVVIPSVAPSGPTEAPSVAPSQR